MKENKYYTKRIFNNNKKVYYMSEYLKKLNIIVLNVSPFRFFCMFLSNHLTNTTPVNIYEYIYNYNCTCLY